MFLTSVAQGSDLPVEISSSGAFELAQVRKLAVNFGSVGLPNGDDIRA